MPAVGSRPAAWPRPLALPPERRPFFYVLVFAVFVLMVPALLGTDPAVLRDGDVSWHVATGQWILANGRIPSADPFSFTMGGKPWVPHEWLADILFGGAFSVAGYSGLTALVTLALVALNLLLFLYLAPRAGPIALFLAMLGLSVALAAFILARPHVLVWPLLAGWTITLLKAVESGRRPPAWLALLMVLWANLHGSFLLGFLIYGFLALEALMAAGWPRRLLAGWAAVGIASVAATLLNANGLAGLIHPLTITSMETLPLIEEWRPTSVDRTPFFFGPLALAAAALAITRPRLPPARGALLVILLAMALLQLRHQTWLAIAAVLLLVPHLSSPAAGAPPMFDGSRRRRTWIASALAAAAAVIAVRLAAPLQPTENEANPAGLLAAIPAELKRAPVLNGYTFGGPLILHGYRPYIDGRADMYGDEFVRDWRRIVDGDTRRFEAAVARYGLEWTMLPRGTELIRFLDRSPEWRRIHADRIGVIHVRREPPASR